MMRFRTPVRWISLMLLALLCLLPVALTNVIFEGNTAEILCPRLTLRINNLVLDEMYPTIYFDDKVHGKIILWRHSYTDNRQSNRACEHGQMAMSKKLRCLAVAGNITRDTVEGTINNVKATLLRFTITAQKPDDDGRLYCEDDGYSVQPQMTAAEKAKTSKTFIIKGARWREDGRCGPLYPMPSLAETEPSEDDWMANNFKAPYECNPNGDKPCCSPGGRCGSTWAHCLCLSCVDFRIRGSRG